jgi:hypothetical protein
MQRVDIVELEMAQLRKLNLFGYVQLNPYVQLTKDLKPFRPWL